MNLERWIERALALQRIPAPPFREAGRAAALVQAFESVGAGQVEVDGVGNVCARVAGGAGPPVVVCAHLDSALDEGEHTPALRRQDRLEGPGIGDNAIAVAALPELFEDLTRLGPPGDVWLIGDVGEEGLGNLRGMQAVTDRFGPRPTAYLALEGLALGSIYHRALPVRRYRIALRAPGGHAWLHHGRPSAIHAAARLATALLALRLPQAPRTTLNIGSLCGGGTINALAAQASLEVELRSEQTGALEALAARVEAAAREAARGDLAVECTPIGHRPGGSLPADHALVRVALEVYRRAALGPPRLEIASTDASLPLSRGYPALCVGLTQGGGAHSQAEYALLEPLPRGYAAVLDLIRSALELPSPDRRPA